MSIVIPHYFLQAHLQQGIEKKSYEFAREKNGNMNNNASKQARKTSSGAAADGVCLIGNQKQHENRLKDFFPCKAQQQLMTCGKA